MSATKKEKNTIMRFITHYRSLKKKPKQELRNKVIEECGFSYNTFYYKLEHMNWDKLEIDKIDEIFKDIKHGTKKH